MKQFFSNWTRGSGGTEPPLKWLRSLALTALFTLGLGSAFAQTDRIPVNDGNFSNGSTFTANGWSVSNGATPNHQWIVSSGHALAAPFSGNAAFISDNGTAYNYTPANNSNVFFWRDVTVPAGDINITLSFNWNQQGENSYDLWQVFLAPTSITPVGNNTHPGFGTSNVPSPITGATYLGNGSLVSGIQSFSATIPSSYAGTTFRVIFSWKNEIGGTQPPAAIDNIRLVSGPNSVPTCHTTLSPVNGATGANLPLTLTWSGASGMPTPTNDVYFSTDQAMVNSNNASVRVLTASSATSYSAVTAVANTTYYWKVVPTNSQGTASGCAVNSFTTAALSAAACPASYTPANSSTGVTLPVSLSWAASAGNPIPTYSVFFSSDAALVSARDVSVRQATGISATTWNPTGVVATGTTYYWMVVPTNTTGSPSSCTMNSFTTVAPTSYTATSQGGLWSSPGTWVGGVVPPSGLSHNVTIPSGSVVTIDQIISYRNITINGTLQWNGTANAMSASGDVTIGSTGKLYGYSSAGGGVTIHCLGDFTNNGYANLYLATMNFTGSGSQSFGGTGTYQGNGSRAVIGTINKQNTGTVTVGFPCNVRTLNPLNGTIAGASNIQIDFTKSEVWGQSSFNSQVSQAVVTGMGAGYAASPLVGPSGAALWVASTAVSLGNIRMANGQVYACTVAGTTSATAPSHTSGTATDGGATWLWVGASGSVGNAFVLTAVAGTQYFYGNNLYTCTVAGTASAAVPPTHTTGIAASGSATFQYVGAAAKISLNYDATNLVVRSANITTAGSGYLGSPTATIVPLAAPTSSAAITLLAFHRFAVAATGNATLQKSGASSVTGMLGSNIAGNGSVSISASNGGRYATAPAIGISAPNAINLAHLPGFSGGSGYTVAPTAAAFTGGTLISGTSAVTPVMAGGKVIAITLGTGTYSVPPTGITFTGGTFATAASTNGTFTTELANRWAQFTANLTNGQITAITTVNAGFDYTTASVGLPTAGAGEIGATMDAKVALYSISLANFTPTAPPTGADWATLTAPAGAPHNEATNLAGLIPASRKANALTIASGSGQLSLTGNLTLIAAAPLTLTQGALDMGGNDLIFQNGGYAGVSSGSNAWVQNGRIQLNTVAAGARTFPFKATGLTGALVINTGGGTGPIGGSDITQLRASQTAAPTGAAAAANSFTGSIAGTTLTVTAGSGIAPGMTISGTGITTGTVILNQSNGVPGGAGAYTVSVSQTVTSTTIAGSAVNMTGTRGYQVDVLTGSRFGTASTFHSATMGFDLTDNLVANNQNIVLCQSNTGISSGWAVRGQASAAGTLAATGTRLSNIGTATTATTTASAQTGTTITLSASILNVAVGMQVVGNGIPEGTTVSSVTSGTVFVVSNSVTMPASTVLSFFSLRPIQFASTMYIGMGISGGFAAPAALDYTVQRTTGNAYNSIMPTTLGGDGTGLDYTSSPGWSTASNDDGVTNVVVIPSSTFTYQGSLVTGFRAGTNGNLQLQNALAQPSSTAYSNQLSTLNNILAVFWEDLTTNPNSGGTTTLDASMRYKIGSGSPGTRKIIAEWFKMTQFGNAGPELYFQVVLDENDNSITYNYGNMQMFNGTVNLRYTYSMGMNGAFISPFPQQGQVFANQYENSTSFSPFNVTVASLGSNALSMSPAPRSSYKFTPGTYVAPTPFDPVVSAPANDNVAGAQNIKPMTSFPSNIAWNTFEVPNRSNYFTLRGATQSPQSICGGPANAKDVWFKFKANDPNIQVRIYPSGGMTPVLEVLDASLNPLSPTSCNIGTIEGLAALTTSLTGLTVNNDYYVRVYNAKTGNTASFSSLVGGGVVVTPVVLSGGTNYPALTTAPGPLMRVTGGGGQGAVFSVTNTAGVLALSLSNGGLGYTSAPTITVDSPDWGYTGEFGIILYAAAANDEPTTATTLTNLTNTNCVSTQNSRSTVYTGSATASLQAACAGTADDDVWYKFKAGATGFTNIRVKGAFTYLPGVEIWSAGATDFFPATASNCYNTSGASDSVNVNLPTVQDEWYYVRVYHWGSGSAGSSYFDICVKDFVPPAGFWCPTAINVPLSAIPYASGAQSTLSLSNIYGAQQSTCSNTYGTTNNDVVYKLDLSALTQNVQLNISAVNTSSTGNIGWFLKGSSDCSNLSNTLACAVSGTGNTAAADVAFGPNALTAGIYYLQITYNGSVVSSNYTLNIDYSCPTVVGLASSGVTSSTASITWGAQDMYASYNVQYRLVGAPSWTNWSGNPVSTTNTTLTGLTSASSYEFRVAATCNGPATASNSTAFAFNTLCPTFTAPLNQNFNSGFVLPSLPVCWGKLVQNLPGASVISTASGSPVSGNQVALYNGLSSNASGQVMLISPQLTDINNLANPNRLSFSARAATVPVTTNANPCNTSTSAFGSGTPSGNTLVTISTCSYTTEYSTVTLVQDSAYQITISLNKYITITNSTGATVYQTGQSPQTFVAPASGTYRLYWSDGLAPSCGGVSTCHTTTIQKVALPESPTSSSVLVGTMSDPSDASTFTQKASIDITGTHTAYTVDFFDYTGSNQYLVLKHGESTLGTNKTVFVDNFGWNAIPPCSPPLGLTVSNITVGSAQLSWNTVFDAVNGYAVQYQVAGDLTWTDAPGSPIAFGTNNVVVNDLDPGTAYNWRVAAVCGSGNSGYASGTSFSTLCNPVSVPYSEGFESILVNNQLPNCLTATNLSTRTFTYKLPVGSTSNSVGAPRSALGFATIVSANTAPGDYLFTPAISMTGGTAYQLRFWYRRDAFTSTTNNLTAWFGSAATSVGMTTQIGTTVNLNNGTAGTYQLFTANFTPSTDGVYYVGLRRLSGTPATGYVSIDDISIDFPATCADPSGVAVSGVPTTTSLAVNWTENGTATAWDIEYGPSPYTFTGTPTITNTTSKPYTFTGLSANTQYDVRIRARCGAGNLSDWSPSASVKTACGTITTFPWNYSFEDVTTVNVLANCDATYPATLSSSSGIAVYPTAPVTPITTGSSSYNRGPRTGNAFAAHYYTMGNSADSSVYFTPMFNLTAGTFYKFSMYYRSDATGGWPRLMCSYGPNQSVAGMLPISGARANNIPGTATSYTLMEGYFSPSTSGNYCIGVSSLYAAAPWHLSFDDLRLEVTPCLPPSAFSTSVGSSSVTWSATNPTAGFVPTNYQIEYNTTGVFTGTPNVTLTPTNTALGAVNTLNTTGLAASTRYYYRYRSNCGANQSSWSVSASFVTKPVNDDCSAAITVTPSSTIICTSNISGNTLGATASLGTALNASTQCTGTQSNPDDDVWYKFVATATQHVVTVYGSSGFDAVLELRNSTAGTCPGITPAVGCSNATIEGGAESITLNTVVGNTYYVRVWSATTNAATVTPTSALPITNTFTMCISTPSVLAGATCATAITVNSFPYTQNYTTQGGDNNVGLQNSCGGTYGGGEDIFYKLVIVTAGTRTITVQNLNGTGYIGWFLKSSANCSATNLGSNLSCAVSGATDVASGYYYFAPGTYYLAVDYDAISGPSYSNYRISIVNAPANDDWNASAVSYLSPALACNSISGTVANATPSAGVPTNFTCGGNADDDVWYRFVAVSTTHLVTLTGNSFVDRVEAFANLSGSLSSLGCATASSGTAQVTLSGLTVGNTYYVRVYSSATGPATNTALNNFSLCLQIPAVNDEICGAVTLTAGAFVSYTSGNNQFATNSASIAGSCANFGSNFNRDLWYRVQAPADGVLAINVLPGTFADHDMQVWSTSNQTTPCSGTLTSVACDLSSGVGSEPYLYLTGLTANNWYFIQIRSNPAVTGGGTFSIAATNAVNWTGAVSTAYENPGNWFNGDAVPSLGSNVAFPLTTTKPVVNSSPTVNNLFMAEGSMISVTLNNLFKVRNNITVNPNASGLILGDGKVQFTANAIQTITGRLVVNNAELVKTGGSLGFGSNSSMMVYGLFTPTSGTMNTSSNLIIASNLNGYTALNGDAIYTNGQIATGSATVNGNVVVERRISAAGYHHLSNPVTSAATVSSQYGDDLVILGPNGYIYDIDPALPQPPTFPNLWFYDDDVINSPTRLGWVNAAGSPYASGKGLFGVIPTARVLETVGTITNGNVTAEVKRGATTAGLAARGFNLLGNPYATNLNLVAFLQQNSSLVENALYIWNASINNYATATINTVNSTVSWTNAPVSNATRIPHSQGFFIRKTATGTANVTFTNAMRATTSAQTFLNSPLANARFSIRNGAYGDEAVIILDPQSNTGSDKGDATKLTSVPAKTTMLYSVSEDGENLAINSVPEFRNDMMIPLGVVVGEGGSVTIQASDLTAFAGMPNVYLYDAVLNKEVDLRTQSAYTVNLTEGNVGSRFFITFESKVKASVAAAGLNIYANDNKVFVAFPVETGTATIEIMNVLGQTLSTANVSAFKGLKEVSVDGYSAGNYLVKVTADGQITSQKVFIGRK